MGQYRTIWDHTAPQRTIRDNMGPYGNIQDHRRPNKIIRNLMRSYGIKWDHKGTYVTILDHKGL